MDRFQRLYDRFQNLAFNRAVNDTRKEAMAIGVALDHISLHMRLLNASMLPTTHPEYIGRRIQDPDPSSQGSGATGSDRPVLTIRVPALSDRTKEPPKLHAPPCDRCATGNHECVMQEAPGSACLRCYSKRLGCSKGHGRSGQTNRGKAKKPATSKSAKPAQSSNRDPSAGRSADRSVVETQARPPQAQNPYSSAAARIRGLQRPAHEWRDAVREDWFTRDEFMIAVVAVALQNVRMKSQMGRIQVQEEVEAAERSATLIPLTVDMPSHRTQSYVGDEMCIGCRTHGEEACLRSTVDPDAKRPCEACQRRRLTCAKDVHAPEVPPGPSGSLPTTAEEWAGFMVEEVGRWEERIAEVEDTLEDAIQKSHRAMEKTIASSVEAMCRDTAAAQKRVKKYALSSASDLKEMKDAVEKLTSSDASAKVTTTKALGMLHALHGTVSNDVVPLVNRQTETINRLAAELDKATAANADQDAKFRWIVDKLATVASRMNIDIGRPPEPLFLPGDSTPSPPHPPALPTAPIGRLTIGSPLFGSADERDELMADD
ncbi:hypothetical protein PUNSTDRAFT_48004 [Punctularia strigosozonata HHB-11173 SS5]|uniref:Uncharacterized protein n=1 Tax=Punctularia strigosozonata (strain HHB-11173) TaxID=741275 RepID=R7S2P5_PUNST|nr:uncharacterized protein PUNSTDRAFT_48004 [Punctularia strigosozonata HHB-11173 SS5]EIN03521.1 hypothetical protein PUNSTDRAFT_48004 [Punctularia strigosozonata HHB-11173 SS5]